MSYFPLLRSLLENKPLDSLYDQNFGIGIFNDHEVKPTNSLMVTPMENGYLRPWRSMSFGESGISAITTNKAEFKVNVDVQQFKEEELDVKVTNGYIVVEGKHEERADAHGFVFRHFIRRYKVPDDVDIKTVESTLSADGVLMLKAKKKPTDGDAVSIPIKKSKKSAISVTKDKKGDGKQEKMEQ